MSWTKLLDDVWVCLRHDVHSVPPDLVQPGFVLLVGMRITSRPALVDLM